MIIGVVNDSYEATIPIVVRGTNGQEHEIEAVIDTGFTGFLTLPNALVESLELGWLGREQGILGDGSLQIFDVYASTVLWDGETRIVETNVAETKPLVGMGLIYHHDLRIQVVSGGNVTIEAL